jgi:hypothetical protein
LIRQHRDSFVGGNGRGERAAYRLALFRPPVLAGVANLQSGRGGGSMLIVGRLAFRPTLPPFFAVKVFSLDRSFVPEATASKGVQMPCWFLGLSY